MKMIFNQNVLLTAMTFGLLQITIDSKAEDLQIEVHGGATLEEVVIPIIEITKAESDFEFSVLTPNISFSKRKKNACIKVFSKTKLNEITAHISRINTSIKVNSSDGRNFIIDLPELKSSGDYVVDIYINDNLIKSGLKFHADNSDFKEKSLL